MKRKESLGSRIRGWFPKEPILPKVQTKTDFRINPQVSVPNFDWTTVRIAKFSGFFAAFFAAFFAILSSLAIVQNVTEFHISFVSQIGWIGAGLIFGLILSTILILRQLKQLEKNHKYEVRSNDLKILVYPLLLFAALTLIAVEFFYSFQSLMQGTAYATWLISMFGAVTMSFAVRCVLFLAFERKEKVFVIGYWFRSGLYIVPWLNANSSNFSESNSQLNELTRSKLDNELKA